MSPDSSVSIVNKVQPERQKNFGFIPHEGKNFFFSNPSAPVMWPKELPRSVGNGKYFSGVKETQMWKRPLTLFLCQSYEGMYLHIHLVPYEPSLHAQEELYILGHV